MSQQQNARKKSLYIPGNVLERKDIIDGFGNREIGIVVVATAAAAIVFFAIFLSTGDVLIPFTAAIFLIGGTIIAVRKDQHDESLIDKINFVYRFTKTQKKYQYQYKDCLYKDIKLADEEALE